MSRCRRAAGHRGPARLPGFALALALMAWTQACSSPEASGTLVPPVEVFESTTRYRKEYVLAAGDGFEVVVQRHPELSFKYVVRPDGIVAFPLIDEMKCAGLTFRELDEALTTRYATRVREPDLTIIATSVREDEVIVFGEAASTTAVPLRRARTAAQAVALAGGLKPTANEDAVSIIRLGEDGILRAIVVPVELDGQPAAVMALHTVPLQQGDIVFVPKSGIAQVDLFLKQWLNEPLSELTPLLGLYTNYKIIQEIGQE